jgi:hypothetical protein
MEERGCLTSHETGAKSLAEEEGFEEPQRVDSMILNGFGSLTMPTFRTFRDYIARNSHAGFSTAHAIDKPRGFGNVELNSSTVVKIIHHGHRHRQE